MDFPVNKDSSNALILQKGDLKIDRWFKESRSSAVIFENPQVFANVNTIEELKSLEEVSAWVTPSQPILLTSSLHVDDARQAISALIDDLIHEARVINDPTDIEIVSPDKAINHILAVDPLSPIDVLTSDHSAIDGFAFDGQLLGTNNAVISLHIVGTSFAGKPL